MKASEFDEKFDNDEDVTEFLNISTARRPALITKRVNVDFPEWMVSNLDKEAKRLGVTRQALIKLWIAGHLDSITGMCGKPTVSTVGRSHIKQHDNPCKKRAAAKGNLEGKNTEE